MANKMTKSEQYYRNQFEIYLNIVKELGFKVYIKNSDDSNYGWITDGINICHCWLGKYGEGFHLSSVSKTGTRFSMCPDCKELYDVTKENIEYAFGAYPVWSKPKDRLNITKYKDWNEFINQYWDKDNIIEY